MKTALSKKQWSRHLVTEVTDECFARRCSHLYLKGSCKVISPEQSPALIGLWVVIAELLQGVSLGLRHNQSVTPANILT